MDLRRSDAPTSDGAPGRRARETHAGRGALAATFATGLALVSHVIAGGQAPGPLGVAVPLVFATTACVALARLRGSWLRLSVSVGVSQLLFHTLFVLGSTPTPATGVVEQGGAHAGHGPDLSVMVTGAPGAAAMHAGHGGTWMLLAHAVAALVTVLALHHGEGVLRQVTSLGSRLVSVLLRRAARLVVAPVPVGPALPPDDGAWSPTAVRAMATCVVRRGPPLLRLG